MTKDFLRIPAKDMESAFLKILIKNGFSEDQAATCAAVFTANSIDGVYSHGVNRFPKFISVLKEGFIQKDKSAVRKGGFGGIEQWDGQAGAGIINAIICTDRAMELAREHGMGCVAVANTNHWMRGGTYGWRAAREGFVFIGWSNTIANTPAWGAVNSKLGNNPLVIAVPYESEAIVLDMAMSQFSYGALEMYQLKNEALPVPGGYDTSGNLTTDPAEIKKTQRTLPIGYWKGAGLSFLLDVLASILSSGLSVSEITKQQSERNLSQVFIAIDMRRLNNYRTISSTINAIIEDFRQSVSDNGKKIRYPGEHVLMTRADNSTNGIPVSPKIWSEILAL